MQTTSLAFDRQTRLRALSRLFRSDDTTSVGAMPPPTSVCAAGSVLSEPASATTASAPFGSEPSSWWRNSGMPITYASASATAQTMRNRRIAGA